MSAPFFILVREGSCNELWEIIPEITSYTAGEIYEKNYNNIKFNDLFFMVNIIATGVPWSKKSSAKTENWDVVLLSPEFDDTEKAMKLFRKLNKKSRDINLVIPIDKYFLQGPFTLKDIDTQLSNLPVEVFHNELGELRIPHMFWEATKPEDFGKMEYKPTERECDDDTPSDPKKVWEELTTEITEEDVTPTRIN